MTKQENARFLTKNAESKERLKEDSKEESRDDSKAYFKGHKEQNLREIMRFLESNSIQILSTSQDDRPISRPIGSVMLYDSQIWYCMNNDKPMYHQLKNNPHVCICVCASDFSWIRIHAMVVFSDNIEVKNIYLKRPNTSFKSADDPRFSVFYLAEIRAEIHVKNEVRVLEA